MMFCPRMNFCPRITLIARIEIASYRPMTDINEITKPELRCSRNNAKSVRVAGFFAKVFGKESGVLVSLPKCLARNPGRWFLCRSVWQGIRVAGFFAEVFGKESGLPDDLPKCLASYPNRRTNSKEKKLFVRQIINHLEDGFGANGAERPIVAHHAVIHRTINVFGSITAALEYA